VADLDDEQNIGGITDPPLELGNRDRDLVAQEDYLINRLERVDVEGIELRDPRHYQEGRMIVFHTRINGGFRVNEKWRIDPGPVCRLGNLSCPTRQDGEIEPLIRSIVDEILRLQQEYPRFRRSALWRRALSTLPRA
jgi:hypothetical protein